ISPPAAPPIPSATAATVHSSRSPTRRSTRSSFRRRLRPRSVLLPPIIGANMDRSIHKSDTFDGTAGLDQVGMTAGLHSAYVSGRSGVPHRVSDESVTHSGHVLDKPDARRAGRQFLVEAEDEAVQIVVVKVARAPDRIADLILGDDIAASCVEHFEQVEFL